MVQSVQRVCRKSRDSVRGPAFALLSLFLWNPVNAHGAPLGGLREVPLSQLSSQPSAPLAVAALALSPTAWKHAETEHFIYHYVSSAVATPVSVEAESYYRVITGELGLEASPTAAKCHLFVVESPAHWQQLMVAGELESWTGGLHASGTLFILRDPAYKFKGMSLAHEVTHLVWDRIAPGALPLWLEEGYAEYVGVKAYASFMRARNYLAKPRSTPVRKGDYIPLATLLEMTRYPSEERQAAAFYDESHRLVRLLATDPERFKALTKLLAGGTAFAPAFFSVYGTKYATFEILEDTFKPYALGEVLGG